MKRSLLILSVVALAFTACQKNDELTTPTGVSTPEESYSSAKVTVPSTFTQKVLMEMFSTTGCATCPDAEAKAEAYSANYPDKVYGVNIHTSDAMTSPQFSFLDGLLNVTAFSSGSFNRTPFNGVTVLHKTQWKGANAVSACLAKTASCGLKINTTKSGSTGTVSVTAGFNKSMSGTYKMTVYVVENDVVGTGSGYNQANYYNNIVGSQWYHLGNPIIGYKHGYVLRKVLSANIGDAIPAASITAGGSYTKNYSFSTTGYNSANVYIVAFVNKVGSTFTTHQIMNVQQTKLGTNKAFD